MKNNELKKVEIQYGWFINQYMGFNRVKIFYIKNDKDQNAVFMNYGKEQNNYKIVEDNHFARNGLNDKEKQEIANMLNHNEVELYANN